MKKTKLLKCLLPLLGVSALTIVPILSTACANGVINNQVQSVNETLADETNSSASANTQTGSTSTSIVDTWAETKKEENKKILNNIKWFYKSSNTESDADSIKNELTLKKLDEPIQQIYDLHNGNKIITNMHEGSSTLGFYPYVKLGKNQYTPINLVTTDISTNKQQTTTTIENNWFKPNTNPMLKDKILTMDYFVTDVNIYENKTEKNETPSTPDAPVETQKTDSYKLSIHKLTLSDATSEFPNGDPRTMATLEQPNSSGFTSRVTPTSLDLFNIKRPNKAAVTDILREYENYYKNGKVGEDNTAAIISKLTEIEKLFHNDGGEHDTNDLIFTGLLDSFKKFAKIQTNGGKSNVEELLNKLNEKNPNVFSIIEQIVKGLFNVEGSPLMQSAAEIVEQLTAIYEQYPEEEAPVIDDNNRDYNLKTHAQVREVVEWVVLVLDSTMKYFINFALDLYGLVSTCLEQVNWPNPIPNPIKANLN